MRIAITGSTGMIGSTLVSFLLNQGHQVTQITRHSLTSSPTPFIVWNPDSGLMDALALEGHDVVIHLAGTNVGERWSAAHKKSIVDSRVKGTRLLCQTLAHLKKKPKVLLSASAIGYYGNHPPDKILDENSLAGQGFLPDVCKGWEEETKIARDSGIRVVNMRFGVVLSKQGGALKKMWGPFQMGLGGILGSGKQMMSWIALDEIPHVIDHLMQRDIFGPVNVVSPKPVSNKEFTKVLSGIIKRPTLFPVPAIAVKLLFGEMGQQLLLEGSRVMPRRLQENAYQFHYPDIKSALQQAVR